MDQRCLFVDTYAGTQQIDPDWSKVVEAPDFYGAIIKATEGTGYHPPWFSRNWSALRSAGGERYGTTWFRGAYHFLKFNKDGAAQADYFLDAVDAAGGWDTGDIIPVVDVELGNDGSQNPSKRNSNWNASGQQIIDCTSDFAERARARCGQQVMLYGNGAMRDKAINDRMGCDWLWIPRYTPTLPEEMYQRAGWQLPQVALWQYCGDNQGALPNYPTSIAGFGECDISVSLFATLADFQNKVASQLIEIEPQ